MKLRNKQEVITTELQHAKLLLQAGSKQWFWQGAANKKRAERRVRFLFDASSKTDYTLELGSGTGMFSKEFPAINSELFCIVDLSSELLLCSNVGIPTASLVAADCEKLPFVDNSFNFIFGSSILHHLDLNSALSEIYRVLKPGGTISFCEPNLLNPQIFLQKKIPLLKRLAGDLEHETAWSRFRVAKSSQYTGFIDVSCKPFDFLHPIIPEGLVDGFEVFGSILESIPIVREFAGSWHLTATKPES
jgi:SAM-dependent methyltransferase